MNVDCRKKLKVFLSVYLFSLNLVSERVCRAATYLHPCVSFRSPFPRAIHMMSASGHSCPVLRKGDKSCRTGQPAGDKQLLGGPAHVLRGWMGSALAALTAGFLLLLETGIPGTPWTAQVASPDVDPAMGL